MSAQVLPETAAVYWRPRVDARSLERRGRLWTLTTVAHTIPFITAAAVLFALQPLSAPVGAIMLAHAWVIPMLYANRGAKVLRREVVDDVLPHLAARDLLFDVDLLAAAGERGWRVVEVPTVWIDQEGSRVKAVSDSRRMGTSLLRLWLRRRVFA